MKPMNDLLADIVAASGGTVTSNARNGLLDDWLDAVSNPVVALTFTSQPQAKTVDEYALATFSCEVTGGVAPYSYQWKKNGTNVGTNSAALSFAAAATDNGASITCVVTDSVGSVIASSAAALGVTSYVYQLDGVTQHIKLGSTINVSSGDEFEINFRRPLTSSRADDFIIAREGAESYVYFRFNVNNGVPNVVYIGYTVSMFGVFIDGVAVTKSTDLSTYFDNNTHTLKIIFASSFSFDLIGVNHLIGQRLSGSLGGLRYKKSAVVTNQIPLNNKSQGANQLATVGNINAAIVNYNAAGWVAI